MDDTEEDDEKEEEEEEKEVRRNGKTSPSRGDANIVTIIQSPGAAGASFGVERV